MQIPLKSVTKGSNTNVSPLVHPIDQPYLMNGCNNAYKIGAVTKDTGYELVGSQIQAGKNITGLYNFRQVAGTEKMLATMDNAGSTATQLFYRAGGAWTEIAAAETAWANKADMKVEMESFIGYCFFVGYGETDGFLPVASLTGNTFSTTTNLTSMPQGKFIKRYNGQLYVANCYTGGNAYPFRVYNSSFPVAGAITWDSVADSTAGYKDVDFSDEITGMESAFGSLFVFTEYQTYAWDQASWLPKWAQGCVSHRTIKKHKAYMIWCDLDGVQVTTGGQPQNISGEIDTFYKAGNPRNYHAEIVNEQYWLYMGNLTVDGVNYTNLVGVFDIGKSIWFVRELYDSMTILAKYNDSGKMRLYMGNNNGQVFNKGQYSDTVLLNSDNGHDISSSLELAPFHLDNLERYKKLNSIICFADRPGGVKVYARVIDTTTRVTTPYTPIGELTRYINTFDVDIDDGIIIQIMLQETGQNPYWSFLGFSMDVLLDSIAPKY